MKTKTDEIAYFLNTEIIPKIEIPKSNDEKQIEKYIKKILKIYKSKAKEKDLPADKEILKIIENDLKSMMIEFFK